MNEATQILRSIANEHREKIAALESQKAQVNTERDRVVHELRAVDARLGRLDEMIVTERAELLKHERALEILGAPEIEPSPPEPVEPDPVPPVTPERPPAPAKPMPVQPGTRQRPKPSAAKAAKKAAKRAAQDNAGADPVQQPARAQRYSKDPLTVQTRTGKRGPDKGKRAQPRPVFEAPSSRVITPTTVERAKLLLDLLSEQDCMSQHQMATDIAILLECGRNAAQGIVSECLSYLIHTTKDVIYTGRKAAVRPDGRLVSPIYKAVSKATPPERAAAGLGVHEDDFAGTTTRPVDARARGARITVESSQFEAKR